MKKIIVLVTGSLLMLGSCGDSEQQTPRTTGASGGELSLPGRSANGKTETPSKSTDQNSATRSAKKMKANPQASSELTEIATFGGGCFWCTEAVMERLNGVIDVESGYMGGQVDHPSYQQVCSGTTGHAEVIQVKYDKTKISYSDLLDIFWQAHDPTTFNRQGHDVGPQYRSVIFYHTPEQKQLAEASKKRLDSEGILAGPIVTEITEASTFWKADDGHQNYYRLNKDKNPYCRMVITPKMKKLGLE